MTVYGVIFAAVVRKVKALVAEYRKLVAEVKAEEAKLVAQFEADIQCVLADAKAEEERLLAEAEQVIEAGDKAAKNLGQHVESEKNRLKNIPNGKMV